MYPSIRICHHGRLLSIAAHAASAGVRRFVSHVATYVGATMPRSGVVVTCVTSCAVALCVRWLWLVCSLCYTQQQPVLPKPNSVVRSPALGHKGSGLAPVAVLGTPVQPVEYRCQPGAGEGRTTRIALHDVVMQRRWPAAECMRTCSGRAQAATLSVGCQHSSAASELLSQPGDLAFTQAECCVAAVGGPGSRASVRCIGSIQGSVLCPQCSVLALELVKHGLLRSMLPCLSFQTI